MSDRGLDGSSEILNSMTIWGGETVCPLVVVVAPFKEEYEDKGTEGGHWGDDPYGVTLKGAAR